MDDLPYLPYCTVFYNLVKKKIYNYNINNILLKMSQPNFQKIRLWLSVIQPKIPTQNYKLFKKCWRSSSWIQGVTIL